MVWRADVNRFTVMIGRPPAQFAPVPLIVAGVFSALVIIEEGEDGAHAVLGEGETITHLRIEPDARQGGCILLPLEPQSRTRSRAAHWLLTRLDGGAPGPSPEGAWNTAARRSHLTMLLQLLDGTRAGLPLRELAAILLDPDVAALSAAAWVDSAERKRLRRWLDEARRLVAGGYVALLGGP